MSFDKNKAMRNAERFLSQGKIRAAINEYQRVVENDPKDFSTLNILGDLHAKNRDKREAVGCFTQVADHYNMQGFAHKAIAVYNKISRIEPNSIEVSAKLAELYQSKGSVAEARQHYTKLAEHYQSKGQKIEALAIWKQIAELDPNNTDIYLKIAETCWQEEQFDEAARAFTEAGLRFLRQEKFESALTTFSRALEIKKNDLRALKGSVKAQIGLGYADEAAKTLEEVLQQQPHNRDILHLLIDCYLDINNAPEAERTIIKLVEQEPANYLKFFDLVKIYLKSGNVDSAVRVLSIGSEQMIAGGQGEEFLQWVNEVLARNPEQLTALRLLVRYYTWQRDENAIKQSLERLAEVSRMNGATEDEHFALSQLAMIAPPETESTQRLQELNSADETEAEPTAETNIAADVPQYENFNAPAELETNGQNDYPTTFDFADVKSSDVENSFEFESNDLFGDIKEFEFYNPAPETAPVENIFETFGSAPVEPPTPKTGGESTVAGEYKLQKELESVEFYISQGYLDLAAKSLDEIEVEFGQRAEIAELRGQLGEPPPTPVVENLFAGEEFAEVKFAEPESAEEKEVVGKDVITQYTGENNGGARSFENLDDFRNELGFEDDDTAANDDNYETHYQMATAYKEMGLMENAIKEFQEAINLVKVNDESRRFFQCANLLGHCFMEKQMPNLAITWYERALKVPELNDEEKIAVYYELGNAFEVEGKIETAIGYFEKLYAENVNYRDVSERLDKLNAANPVA